VELEDGKIACASTRLKVVGRTITRVETGFDDSANVAPPTYIPRSLDDDDRAGERA